MGLKNRRAVVINLTTIDQSGRQDKARQAVKSHKVRAHGETFQVLKPDLDNHRIGFVSTYVYTRAHLQVAMSCLSDRDYPQSLSHKN